MNLIKLALENGIELRTRDNTARAIFAEDSGSDVDVCMKGLVGLYVHLYYQNGLSFSGFNKEPSINDLMIVKRVEHPRSLAEIEQALAHGSLYRSDYIEETIELVELTEENLKLMGIKGE